MIHRTVIFTSLCNVFVLVLIHRIRPQQIALWGVAESDSSHGVPEISPAFVKMELGGVVQGRRCQGEAQQSESRRCQGEAQQSENAALSCFYCPPTSSPCTLR
eukprot:Polyplicarium_translucidae@DN3231_c1_g1_i9.p2